MLVVVFGDGSPGMIAADATDILGDRPAREAATVVSVEGVRALRALTMVLGPPGRSLSGSRTRK
jgi:hypothetical protein